MQQIAEWLEKLGMSEYAQRFAENDINFSMLRVLTMVMDFVAKAAGKTPAREEFEGLTRSLYQFGKTVTASQYDPQSFFFRAAFP
jgi:hypothetical protein